MRVGMAVEDDVALQKIVHTMIYLHGEDSLEFGILLENMPELPDPFTKTGTWLNPEEEVSLCQTETH
jgi:hypothetical protein